MNKLFIKIDNYYIINKNIIDLFSKIIGIDKSLITKTVIKKKKSNYSFPFYNPKKGGGAITKKNTIIITENFFSNWKYSKLYPYSYFGNNNENTIRAMLIYFSHELYHMEHAKNYKNSFFYQLSFLGEYIIHFGHDKAPREIEANKASEEMTNFLNYANTKFNNYVVEKCIINDDYLKLYSILEEYKNTIS